jgi:hypothetical protein
MAISRYCRGVFTTTSLMFLALFEIVFVAAYAQHLLRLIPVFESRGFVSIGGAPT